MSFFLKFPEFCDCGANFACDSALRWKIFCELFSDLEGLQKIDSGSDLKFMFVWIESELPFSFIGSPDENFFDLGLFFFALMSDFFLVREVFVLRSSKIDLVRMAGGERWRFKGFLWVRFGKRMTS